MKKLIIYALNLCGYQIKRIKHIKNLDYQLYTILINDSPDVILDVGANKGQFALHMIKNGWKADILSFEPLSLEHKILQGRSNKYDNWRVWERCAIGDKPGTIDINISNNSVSSSILKITDKHVNAAPSSMSEKTEEVRVINLSSVIDSLSYESIAVKIDVQGFEKAVLLGLEGSWDKLTMFIVELSQVELYAGQWLEEDVIAFLESKDFKLVTRIPGFIDPKSGLTLQYDGVFKRR